MYVTKDAMPEPPQADVLLASGGVQRQDEEVDVSMKLISTIRDYIDITIIQLLFLYVDLRQEYTCDCIGRNAVRNILKER